MDQFEGQRVYDGYALGKIKVVLPQASERKMEGRGFEIEKSRFEQARNLTINYLKNLYVEMSHNPALKHEDAEIFNIHAMMAEDLDFEDLVMASLNENVTAEYAVSKAGETLSEIFENMQDDYMKSRAQDAKDVALRVVSFLKQNESQYELKEPCIILCEDIPASELVKMNKKYLLGLICTKGSTNSHVAILSRTLEITSIADIGVDVQKSFEGKMAVLDGTNGRLIVDPSTSTILEYQKLKNEYDTSKQALKVLKGKESTTIDGKKTKIYANIASCFEADNARNNDAEGIGLFRSEFIYLEASNYPSEDAQFEQYKQVLLKMEQKEVIIRTMDIGADKKVDYFNLPEEENPALGYRSIRICKDRPEIFLTQLCALFRASIYGTLSIMVPMIISLDEVDFIQQMVQMAKDNLNSRNIPYNDEVKIGIMIETPAAALLADELAKKVDFFSIGTNDLSQYTMAVDRQNPKLKTTFVKFHKGVLRLIYHVVQCAHNNQIPVGICGELAREAYLTPFFLKIGVDELSVSSPYVLNLRKQIRELDTSKVDLKKYI